MLGSVVEERIEKKLNELVGMNYNRKLILNCFPQLELYTLSVVKRGNICLACYVDNNSRLIRYVVRIYLKNNKIEYIQ